MNRANYVLHHLSMNILMLITSFSAFAASDGLDYKTMPVVHERPSSESIEKLVEYAQKHRDPLLEALSSTDARTRDKAVYLLGKLRDSTLVDAIAPLLKDETERVAFTAAETLGYIGSENCVQPLCLSLLSDNYTLSAPVLSALLKIGHEDSLTALRAFSARCDAEIPEQRVRQERAGQIISIIERATESQESRYVLIQELLQPNAPGELFEWALEKVRVSRNPKYASILRKTASELEQTTGGAKHRRRKLLLETLNVVGGKGGDELRGK